MSAKHFQVLIVGSGFGGSLMAMISRRLGYSTGLLERGRHPRFVIGESTTPLTNLLLAELCEEYDLPRVKPLCKWGTWQKEFPQLRCGLKRGFTFYHHELDRPFDPGGGSLNQLLVGASPSDDVADTHWYRPDFDQYLVQQAQALGAEYFDEMQLDAVDESGEAIRLKGRRASEAVNFTADFLIDATGPRGFLFQKLNLPEEQLTGLPLTQALFSHFEGVGNFPASQPINGRTPPYPPENAAVHHVFPGGWIWVLKFNNEITSAGVAATERIAHEVQLRSGAPAWEHLIKRFPTLTEVFGPAQNVVPFVHQPQISFLCQQITGKRWALLPSAAGVVDPLLSTGFPLTLLGIRRLGHILQGSGKFRLVEGALPDYAAITKIELETTARLVGALYSTMDRFDLFKALSLLYFAAASFSEVARRLGKPDLAPSFLLCQSPEFAPQLIEICESARRVRTSGGVENLKRRIMLAIEPFDLAGLTDSNRDPWYPARGEDIYRNAIKLGVTREEIAKLFQ